MSMYCQELYIKFLVLWITAHSTFRSACAFPKIHVSPRWSSFISEYIAYSRGCGFASQIYSRHNKANTTKQKKQTGRQFLSTFTRRPAHTCILLSPNHLRTATQFSLSADEPFSPFSCRRWPLWRSDDQQTICLAKPRGNNCLLYK